MAKRIKNTTSPGNKVENNISIEDIGSHLYKSSNMIIDFSFEGAFVSCKQGTFDSYLQNGYEFVNKFRKMLIDIQNLSQKSPSEIFPGGGYHHCHKVKHETLAADIIKEIFQKIGKNDNNYDQEIGGEEIFQIGLQSEVRIFGTIRGNIFRVYFIDYYHDFEYDQKRTTRNKKGNCFCPISSELS